MRIHFLRNKLASLSQGKPMARVLVLSALFSIGLSFFRLCYTGSGALIFLNWNLLLAVLPLYFSGRIQQAAKKGLPLKAQWPNAVCWMLFLPNAFYLSTDLFHLHQRAHVPLWFDFITLFSFAWNGLLLGLLSLWQVEKIVRAKFRSRFVWLFSPLVLGLCSFGVYLGRYLRYNSWDVLMEPRGLLADIGGLFLHPVQAKLDWGMICCFSTMLLLLHASVKQLGRAFRD